MDHGKREFAGRDLQESGEGKLWSDCNIWEENKSLKTEKGKKKRMTISPGQQMYYFVLHILKKKRLVV